MPPPLIENLKLKNSAKTLSLDKKHKILKNATIRLTVQNVNKERDFIEKIQRIRREIMSMENNIATLTYQ